MEVTVVIPNEEWLGSAGVRIRYERLRPAFERLGHRLVLTVIDSLGLQGPFRSDAYLFCKCYDIRGILLARMIHAAGRPVGIDVFDDYFSHGADPRLVHMGRWLRQMMPHLRFALCATEAMAGRLGELASGLPVHVLPDPVPSFDPEAVAAAVDRKAARARATGVLDLGWFGMGDNPYFAVGLDDLAAWGGAFAELRGTGFEPRLRILTNPRALTPRTVEAIARLPVPVRLDEWNLEAEAALIAESVAVFLPVNAQPFSTVKSLNRAITALTGGAQVWTAGYPLYERLEALLYHSASDVARDVASGELRLRRATLAQLTDLLGREGDPALETGRLTAFLSSLDRASLSPVKAGEPVAWAVIHGVRSSSPIHEWGQSSGVLSVASPFTDLKLNFDLRFEQGPGPTLWAVLSERACGFLAPAHAARLGEPETVRNVVFRRLDLGPMTLPGMNARTTAERITSYPAALAAMRSLMARLLPGVRPLLSETVSPFADTLSTTEAAA